MGLGLNGALRVGFREPGFGLQGLDLISRGTSGYQSDHMDMMVQGLGFKFRVVLGSLGGSGGLSKWLSSEDN